MPPLIIATRGSKLALAQANWTADRLREIEPGLQVELKVIKTTGDKILDVPLAQVGGKGLFVKEIEEALLSGRAQLAVHSMKDVPAELPPGLTIAGVSPREDARDALVSRRGLHLSDLPRGARIGTSSLRRRAQLLAARPDLEILSIRGNVETRLRKMEEMDLDGVILAAAGLTRLGMSHVMTQAIEVDEMLPAAGQGALGFEIREEDDRARELVDALSDPRAAQAVEAERAFLAHLEGGCQTPIAGHARCVGDRLIFQGLVASLDGKRVVRVRGEAPGSQAAALGRRIAREALDQGAWDILAEIYGREPA